MKKFKEIDFYISVALIFISIVVAFGGRGDSFFIGYFVVGGWQVISMLVHVFYKWFCEPGSKRKNYHTLVFIIFVVALLGIALNIILYILLFILLFIAPAMAIFYAWLCYNEIHVKMQRPLNLLK